MVFCLLNPCPSRKVWVAYCETCQAKQVNQLSYQGKEEAVPPIGPRIHESTVAGNTKDHAEALLPTADTSTGTNIIL